MSTQQPRNNGLDPQKALKAEEYEPVADWLLQNGKRLAYHNIGTDQPYEELSAVEKFEALASLYTTTRSGSIGYNTEDALEKVVDIMGEPEAVDASTPEMSDSRFSPENPAGNIDLEEEYPEVEVTHDNPTRTGDPELDQAVRRLEAGEEEWIEGFFTEPSDGYR